MRKTLAYRLFDVKMCSWKKHVLVYKMFQSLQLLLSIGFRGNVSFIKYEITLTHLLIRFWQGFNTCSLCVSWPFYSLWSWLVPVSRLILWVACVGVVERFHRIVLLCLLALNGYLETRAVLNIKVHQLVGVGKEIKWDTLRTAWGFVWGGRAWRSRNQNNLHSVVVCQLLSKPLTQSDMTWHVNVNILPTHIPGLKDNGLTRNNNNNNNKEKHPNSSCVCVI